MFMELLNWWYGRGWLEAFKRAKAWLNRVVMIFSADVLLKTLFAPWKQIITLPGASIDAKFRASIDNLFSRWIGFSVRVFTLLFAGITLLISGALGFAMVVIWPLMPLIFIYCIIRVITG
jgi:hypothetical protein